MKKPDSISTEKPPGALGFRMPAEWEPHEATWLGWPHNRSDWPGKIVPIQWVYGEIVRKLAPAEKVRILVKTPAYEAQARHVLEGVGLDMAQIEFFAIPTNRGWTRDSGPIFISRPGKEREVAIARFRFNAWAKYPDWKLDDKVPELVADAQDRQVFPALHDGRGVVLEGGSIDVNGRGTVLTTEECLLDQRVQVRNPGMTGAQVEVALAHYLGAWHTIWLGRGIAGDDTHGHVDDLCRFVNHRTVVLCREENRKDANYALLAENFERLQAARLEDGSRIQIVEIPMPAPLYFRGQRLPASYANFYIANAAVLVPTFNDPNDRIALGILGDLFPDRPVVGIHCVDLVWGLGTLHCMTQQQPALPPKNAAKARG
jgi:agmatine deiminase